MSRADPPSGKPRICAAIALTTRESLRSLDSLIDQSFPKADYEIAVLGAGSYETDIAALGNRRDGVPKLRLLDAPDGCPAATCNIPLEATEAPILAVLGDLAVAHRDWLVGLNNAFTLFGEDAAMVGGRIAARWLAPRPTWLADQLLPTLGLVDLGEEARFLDEKEHLGTRNIAFATDVLKRIGGFPNSVSTYGTTELLEADVVRRLHERIARADAHTVYTPDAVVEIDMPASRITQSWIRRQAAWRAVAEFADFGPLRAEDAAARWQSVKNFFYELPPIDRTVRGLVLAEEDSHRFRHQVSAVYDTVSCILSGIDEHEDD